MNCRPASRRSGTSAKVVTRVKAGIIAIFVTAGKIAPVKSTRPAQAEHALEAMEPTLQIAATLRTCEKKGKRTTEDKDNIEMKNGFCLLPTDPVCSGVWFL